MRPIETIRESLNTVLWDASSIIRGDFQKALDNGALYEEKISLTGMPDFVTETDKKVEAYLKSNLSAAHPDISFMGEETGGIPDQSGYFLVDPLDGTSNFMSLRNYFGICAAYIEDGTVLAAAVAIPMDHKVMSAQLGKGVFLNNHSIPARTHEDQPLRSVQLECELTFSSPDDFTLAQKLVPHMSGLRKSGSTAVDLAYMAEGRRILCIANHLQPYDIAAPMLIAREAGCVVSDLDGKDATIHSSTIMAARPGHHARALDLIIG